MAAPLRLVTAWAREIGLFAAASTRYAEYTTLFFLLFFTLSPHSPMPALESSCVGVGCGGGVTAGVPNADVPPAIVQIWEGGTRATGFITGGKVLTAALARGSAQATYTGLMHGADWLPTLAEAVGLSTAGTLPLDGVSQWGGLVHGTPPRTRIVIGNSTNECSWESTDPRYHLSADPLRDGADLPAGYWHSVGQAVGKGTTLGCGFAIKEYTPDGHHWKLIKGYGGGPDTWCNSSAAGAVCGIPAGGIAPTPPEPTTHVCPNGWCLYDTASDPHEESEVSSANPTVVARMQAELAQVLLSYRQYEADPSCPPQKFGNDTHVGKTWDPWC